MKEWKTRNDALPEGYKEWIARVSNIVSHAFPFDWTYADEQFRKWLADDVPEKRKRWFAVDHKEYMGEASVVWTFIHLQMEKVVKKEDLDEEDELYSKHRKEIEQWAIYYNDLVEEHGSRRALPEAIVRDKDNKYQWTADLVLINDEIKEVKIYDTKSWGVAKKRWKMPNEAIDKKTWKVKRDLGRFKKVALQLSLYWETYRQKWYTIGGIYVVWLHEEWCFEFSLSSEDFPRQKSNEIRIWSTEEIDKLLLSYKEAEKIKEQLAIANAEIIFNPNSIMIFEIRVPTEAYAYVNVTIDMYQEKDGKTIEEKIDEARWAIKHYLNNVKGK